MHERKKGTLKSGSGKKVKSKKQAKASGESAVGPGARPAVKHKGQVRTPRIDGAAL